VTSDETTQTRRLPWWVGAFVIPVCFVSAILIWTQITKLLGWQQYNYDTETAQMMAASIPTGAFLFVVLLLIWRWSGWTLQGPKLRWNGAVWWTLGIYLTFGVVTFATASRGGGTPDLGLMAGVLVASMFVGITEELTFRGFSLNGFARRLPAFWTVVASAFLFGICHATNVFHGSAPAKVIAQVGFTTGAGLFFGWVYIFSGRNLWLVALVHGLHDFLVVAPSAYIGSSETAATGIDSILAWGHGWVNGMIAFTFPVVLTIYGWQKYKGYTLEQALGLIPVPEPVAE